MRELKKDRNSTSLAIGREIIRLGRKYQNFYVVNTDTKSCGLLDFGKCYLIEKLRLVFQNRVM